MLWPLITIFIFYKKKFRFNFLKVAKKCKFIAWSVDTNNIETLALIVSYYPEIKNLSRVRFRSHESKFDL